MSRAITNILHDCAGPSRSSVSARWAVRGLRRMWRDYRAWRRYRRNLADLRRLPPETLRDLGLDRSHLRALVRGREGFARRRRDS